MTDIELAAERARVRLGLNVRDSRPTASVTSFFPRTAKHQVIYAVVLVDHPDVVKVGQTANWKNRRRAYADWNLRLGDGIAAEQVFLINEEYIDLLALEAAILDRVRAKFAPYRGLEWFRADLDEVCRIVDQVMVEGNISYSGL